ncbi:uncharacterized protein TNCV_103241 [Trichonephila clavipes]|nr:uncharacterized protein TNCV_103241 [Trichonephila clavipes]
MSTLKNSMLELAAKFDDNYNTGLIKSFMFGLNKTEIKTMTDILSRYKFRDSHATRGLLATDHVILNHGQVTWTTPELAPPLLTTSPHQREDVSALDRFNVHRCPTRRVFSGTGLELETRKATLQMLVEAYGGNALSRAQCYMWFEKFQNGDFDVRNEDLGRPSKNFEDAELQALLDEDDGQTQEHLAE